MTIDDEIAWWTKQMNTAKKQELAMVCFGVATGLKLAKADYLKQPTIGERHD